MQALSYNGGSVNRSGIISRSNRNSRLFGVKYVGMRLAWDVARGLVLSSPWGVIWFALIVMATNTNAGARFSRVGSTIGLVIWFVVLPAFGVLGYLASGRFWGGLAGFLIGVAVTWLIFVVRLIVAYPFPECRRGSCRGFWDYKWAAGSLCGMIHWDKHLYWCRCGDGYVRLGKHFMELVGDETLRPYRRLIGFRSWAADDSDCNVKMLD